MKRWLENALNYYLSLDPESERRIVLLHDKTVTIELLSINLTFQLVFQNEKAQIRWNDFGPADLTIKGTPFNLLHMGLAAESRKQFFADDVIVEGNMELAQTVLALFDELEIDWEEWISQWVGDVPAYQVGNVLRGVRNFGKRLRQTLKRNTNEYLHEEAMLFPPAEELNDFFHQVDELRMDVDRLEVRFDQLENRLKRIASET